MPENLYAKRELQCEISDMVDMGNAHELILSCMKEPPSVDDAEPNTLSTEEFFEE